MKRHIGTKLINATPMTRLAYNELRGWNLPEDENGADEGYLVEYVDGGKPNLEGYAGYVSWSPKEQFDNAYRPIDNMTFGLAIEALKAGKKVARAGWNGNKIWIALHKEDGVFEHEGIDLEYLDYVAMKTADNKLIPYIASQTDMLAEDWVIVE